MMQMKGCDAGWRDEIGWRKKKVTVQARGCCQSNSCPTKMPRICGVSNSIPPRLR